MEKKFQIFCVVTCLAAARLSNKGRNTLRNICKFSKTLVRRAEESPLIFSLIEKQGFKPRVQPGPHRLPARPDFCWDFHFYERFEKINNKDAAFGHQKYLSKILMEIFWAKLTLLSSRSACCSRNNGPCLDTCDRSEISKTRKSANLLKKKIAGNIVGKKDKGGYKNDNQLV